CYSRRASSNRNLISPATKQSNQATSFRREGLPPVKSRPPLNRRRKMFEVHDESEHALRGRLDGDLFLVRPLESLRVRGSGDEDPLGANRMPVPFQTGKPKAGALAVTMLQNSTRSCFRPNEKLEPG